MYFKNIEVVIFVVLDLWMKQNNYTNPNPK